MSIVLSHAHRPLGKRAPKHDSRALLLSKYVAGAGLAPPPAQWQWSPAVKGDWPMYLNDQIGDCTVAGAAHMIECWTANGQHTAPSKITDDDVLAAYEQITGYTPSDPSTDQGAVEHDVLTYWRDTGIGGHNIAGWVDVHPQSQVLVQDAIYIFGGAYIGLSLPKTAQSQQVWDVTPGWQTDPNAAPGSWGGHAVPLVDYGPRGPVCVSWGALLPMTWAFFAAYCDEVHCPFSMDFINQKTGNTPQGFNLALLKTDLQKLARVAPRG